MSQAAEDNEKPRKNRLLRACRWCGSTAHSQTFCFKKPRKPITTRRPLKRIGRVGKATASAVAKWKRTQKPNHEGYFECYMCHKWITYLEAEHVKSKAHWPDLRTDPKNLKPTCDPCNEQKRSNDN